MENRERIMQCAEQLFYEKGYDATGVQEIAAGAGVTKPTLYHYFGSKIGLLQDIMETKIGQIRQSLDNVREQEGDLREKLYALADMVGMFFQKEYRFYMLMMAMFYSARENEAYHAVKPYLHEFYQNVEQIFERQEDQMPVNTDRQQLAISFLGTLNQYLVWFYDRNRDDESEMKELPMSRLHAVVDQFLYGIYHE